jgi:hypothetical protein
VLKKASKQNGFYKHSMQSNTSLALWLEHYSMLPKTQGKIWEQTGTWNI